MLKSKDFYFMEVVNSDGRRLGFIKDIIVDFYENKVKGFILFSNGISSKKNIGILKDDIIYYNKKMIAKKVSVCSGVRFASLKNIEINDACGNIIGKTEDIIFHDGDFSIKGIISSSGLVKNYLYGKRILAEGGFIIGDKNILCFEDSESVLMKSLPHSLCTKVK